MAKRRLNWTIISLLFVSLLFLYCTTNNIEYFEDNADIDADIDYDIDADIEEDNLICPKVFKKDNNYIVRNKDYGKQKQIANKIYSINYPDCNLPEILDLGYDKNKNLSEDCPFLINSELNPCNNLECENVNWDLKNPTINARCRRNIDAYAEKFYRLDPKCECWKPEKRGLPVCKKFIDSFKNP